MRKHESGFTLIELVVVIAILAILAATALPRFSETATQARIAKMNGAFGALKSAAAIAHADSLARGQSQTGAQAISMEGLIVALLNGYPDVSTTAAGSGIVVASGGLADYVLSSTATALEVTPDAAHPACTISYTEPAVPNAPAITNAGAIAANCA